MNGNRCRLLAVVVAATLMPPGLRAAPDHEAFFDTHCIDCHDADVMKGGLDLTALMPDFSKPEAFARWVKVHDRIASGEMPPRKEKRPPAGTSSALLAWLADSIVKAEKEEAGDAGRTKLRRLTRGEYENTVRDLLSLPGIALREGLPADGSLHGFDKNSAALDVSHVNIAKYIEAADHALDYAIATQPEAPAVQKRRISLANRGGFVAHIIMNGDGVLLKDKKPDPSFPPAGMHNHVDQGAHEKLGSFTNGSSVGLFRHEDESVSPYFMEHVTIYPGKYRVRTSLWSFQWDKGEVLPARGTEAARLSVVQLTGDGRGGQHPSTVIGYYDAPSLREQVHELDVWLNINELIGFNAASLAPVANYSRKGRAMAFTGPGITVDWLDIEGPFNESWPPRSHVTLFGDLPLAEFNKEENPQARPPVRKAVRQLGAGMNRPDPSQGLWTVASREPLADADRLLAAFLPKAFRRPVPPELRREYVALVEQRIEAGDCFETAMRWAYRAALCSPDFLYHVEPAGELDDHALACRLSYFLWNSLPDEKLAALAAAGELRKPGVLKAEAERLLSDPKSRRFIDDFLGQWLKLRQIAANDPDKKLYPEFSPYLQDSMVAETRAYFRELLEKDLDAAHFVKSGFVMINEKLAQLYGIPGVTGSEMRRVSLPPDSPRGGFLTQASVLKVTANGTTTSPVPRGAFVLERLLGQPPEPPPSSVPAVEPDVRGATTIREQLEKHRADATCASCHARIDPPGFALESFDVIGAFRDRYRSLGEEGLKPERGNIDPFIPISFRLGPPVDPSGEMLDGRTFSKVEEFKDILATDRRTLERAYVRHLAAYSTGRELAFSDRPELENLLDRAEKQGAGIRTVLLEFIQSPLFRSR